MEAAVVLVVVRVAAVVQRARAGLPCPVVLPEMRAAQVALELEQRLEIQEPQEPAQPMALLGLERKLARRPDLLQSLRTGLEEVIQNLNYFSVDHSNAIARFADLYLNSLSTLTPRIMVNGDPIHLNNPDNANRIRALLLAGVRAAILWRQSGGGRLTLLLRRNPLLRETRRLLASLE